MQKQHILMVLLGTNLVSNISTKASKKHYIYCQISTFLQRNKSIAHSTGSNFVSSKGKVEYRNLDTLKVYFTLYTIYIFVYIPKKM